MNVIEERHRQDVARLEALCASSAGRLRIVSRCGQPVWEITVELRCRTAGSLHYPSRAIDKVRATIQLPARYPFQPPRVVLSPTVFHPNVFTSGQVCLGSRWLPTESLDLLVRRVVQIVTFDPTVLNTASPANPQAVAWYLSTLRASPGAFPTDTLPLFSSAAVAPQAVWRDLPVSTPAPVTSAARETTRCGQCGRQLRVPSIQGVRVRCPACQHIFQVAR